jgi:hypothetical protein
MNVLITANSFNGGLAFLAGNIQQIPEQFFMPNTMTRLGAPLSLAQRALRIDWSTFVGSTWPQGLNDE